MDRTPINVDSLIIKSEWLFKIFNTQKVYEMRSTATKKIGPIGLIKSGSGLIVGSAYLNGCFKIDPDRFASTLRYHQVPDFELLKKWPWAWVLSEVEKFETPVKYSHPQGAVIWVKNSF
jgi:hypothetical protein